MDSTNIVESTIFQVRNAPIEGSSCILLLVKEFKIYSTKTVFEINGAHGARRAHFRGRAHVFRTCAPDVCTFFHSILIAIY